MENLLKSIDNELVREKITAFIVALRLLGREVRVGKNRSDQYYIEFSNNSVNNRLFVEISYGEISYAYGYVDENKYFSYNYLVDIDKFYKMLDSILIYI